MDFLLSEEEKAIKQKAREFGQKECAPYIEEWLINHHVPRELDRKLAGEGLLGISIPVQYGGLGKSIISAAVTVEELSRVGLGVSRMTFYANFGPPRQVEQWGSEYLKKKYLPALCRGEIRFSAAMSEPDAGSALTDLKTTAVLDGEHYVVNGHKRFCTGAGDSDVYLTYVRLSDRPGAGGIGGILVDKGTAGLTFGRVENFMGAGVPPTGDVLFNNCRVPKDQVLVGPGEFKKLMSGYDLHRSGNVTLCLGLAVEALEKSIAYSKKRYQWGKPICEFQAIQLKLAEMGIKVEAMRLLAYQALSNAGRGVPSVLQANMAKCFANESTREIAGMAVQIHGGYGYNDDYHIDRLLRDGWGMGIGGGTIDMQKLTIASQLLGRKFDHRK